MSFIPVLDIFRVWLFTCTLSILAVRIPVYMINMHILVSDYCIVFARASVMFIFDGTSRGKFFRPRKYATPVAYYRLGTIKRQHCVADVPKRIMTKSGLSAEG